MQKTADRAAQVARFVQAARFAPRLADIPMHAAGEPAAEARAPGAVRRIAASEARPNRTGLPDALKAGVESLSGVSLDDVRVRYGSAKPAQLQALAYTQGPEIHLAPGQERHLPHEAWHAAQQKQGRVAATAQRKGVALNDDASLEREADVMGARAARGAHGPPGERRAGTQANVVVQGVFNWVENAANNKRKVGAEITEDRAAGNNTLNAVTANAAWAPLGGLAQAALWTDHADLPDRDGATIHWQVADFNTLVPAYFDRANGAKGKWMN